MVSVDVTTLDGRALAKYRRDDVGIVFQAFNLVPSLTALENVMVPLRAAGMSRAASRQRAEELLARVNLAERMKFCGPRISEEPVPCRRSKAHHAREFCSGIAEPNGAQQVRQIRA